MKSSAIPVAAAAVGAPNPTVGAGIGSDASTRGDASSRRDASTRRQVTRSILEHGPSTAVDLAARLQVTPAAIRRHLSALLDSGCLVARERRTTGQRGRGRPAKVFALTDAGRADFTHAYDDLAVRALRALADTGGDAAVREFSRDRLQGVRQRYAERSAADPGRGGGEVLAEVLTEHGYVASTQPGRADGEQLCQHHCPIAHVAEQFPQLCEAETEVFAELLGVHVQRLATIAKWDGVCTTNIPQASRTPGPGGQPGPSRTPHPRTTPDASRTPRARKAAR